MEKKFRGIFAIPPTVFFENLQIDYEGIRESVRFLLRCGVHGVVSTVFASEYFLLNDDERRKVLEVVLKEVDGKVPVVAGITCNYNEQAIVFAQYAQANGASAVLAMNPPKLSPDETREYFWKIDKAINLPIFIQNQSPPSGKSMTAEFMMSIVKGCSNDCYMKEESEPSNTVFEQAIKIGKETPGSKLAGVMGGKGSRPLFEEYVRGSCGSMPPAQFADVLVDIWNLLEKGDMDAAYDLHNQIMPALVYGGTYKLPSYKEIMKRRGVIASTVVRPDGFSALSPAALKDLDYIMEKASPLLRVK